MPKLKLTTIYNKNHIKIEKREYDYNPGKRKSLNTNPVYNYITERDICTDTGSYHTATYYKRGTRYNNVKEQTITVRKKSPLGFYYNHKEIIRPENVTVKTKGSSYKIKEYRFFVGDTNYTVTYYTEYNGQHANKEMHPWELADNNSMADHYVTALINELNKLFEIASEHKCSLIKDEHKNYFNDTQSKPIVVSITQVKKNIFTDLFGFPDGPKYQTDMEKLLAHGFDPKMGFRNRPEK